MLQLQRSKESRRHRQHRSSRRHFRDGRRAAALRALTAARLHLQGQAPSLAAAAAMCGSCLTYTRAAATLWKSENSTILNEVLAGRMPLLAAAHQVQRVADLVASYRAAQAPDRIAFVKAAGTDKLFDVLTAALD